MPQEEKDFVVVVQCRQVVDQTCAGFLCEHAFNARADGFAHYPADRKIRFLTMDCGGCPGRGTLRKLTNLKNNLKKRESVLPERVAVHLSSCITRTSHHGPRCPHIDYIKNQVREAGFGDCVEDSRYSKTAEKRRAQGMYA
jgi:predicted metal-binding protein